MYIGTTLAAEIQLNLKFVSLSGKQGIKILSSMYFCIDSVLLISKAFRARMYTLKSSDPTYGIQFSKNSIMHRERKFTFSLQRTHLYTSNLESKIYRRETLRIYG